MTLNATATGYLFKDTPFMVDKQNALITKLLDNFENMEIKPTHE